MEPNDSIVKGKMEPLVVIGGRLREVRQAMGLSQTDFAEIALRAGVTGSTRQSQALYEKGERAPDAGYLTAIAAAGVDVAYVLTGMQLQPAVREQFRTAAALTMQAAVSDEERAELQRLHIEAMRGHAHLSGVASAVTLTARETALVDNYRHASEAGQKALDVTGAALAQSKSSK